MLPLKLLNVEIEVTPEDIELCAEFSRKYNYNKHKDRDQFNLAIQKMQNIGGKMLELAAVKYLRGRGSVVTDPDFKLYPPHLKSFAPDLIWNNKPTHVKSQPQTSSEIHGESYTFQFADRKGRQDGGDYDRYIFDNPESKDRIVCGIVEGNKVIIRAITEVWVFHKHNLFKPSHKYPTGKRVVYYDDMEKLKKWEFTGTLAGNQDFLNQ